MQWWMNAVDYPLNISGKPLFSLPANIPITFELTVLFSALDGLFRHVRAQPPAAVLPLRLFGRRLPPGDQRRLLSGRRRGRSDVRRPANGRPVAGGRAQGVETCYEPAEGRKLPGFFGPLAFVLALAALVPLLLVAKARAMRSAEQPRLHIIQDMDFQEKYKPQAASPLFADGRAERLPVPGTVARGELEADRHLYAGKPGDGQWAATFPAVLAVTAQMRRGQQMFNIYCAACHGLTGLGDGMVLAAGLPPRRPKWVRRSSLQDEAIRKQPLGQLFDTISQRHAADAGLRTSDFGRGPLEYHPLPAGLAAEPERHAGRRAGEPAR